MKLMVIDGNSIINRAYYGIRPLTNREGLYTHAIFGFLTTLLRLVGEEAPDALCVTFDVHAPTFRHTADETYKATRKPMPELSLIHILSQRWCWRQPLPFPDSICMSTGPATSFSARCWGQRWDTPEPGWQDGSGTCLLYTSRCV